MVCETLVFCWNGTVQESSLSRCDDAMIQQIRRSATPAKEKNNNTKFIFALCNSFYLWPSQLLRMIQRIQTVYLFIAAICGALTFFFTYAHFMEGDVKIAEYAMFGVFNVQSDTFEMTGPYGFPAWVLGALTTLLPFVAIFLYKKRPVQYRIARLAFLANLTYAVYLFFATDAIAETLYQGDISVLHHIGFYLPVAALPLCFLAVRGIKKDEALVKSLDRIR